MPGIKSYGVYIPRYRLSRGIIYSATGFLGAPPVRGEKAVANHDEDSITMAVAAGINCLDGVERDKVNGLVFATVSPPYALRQNAAIIATALDLPQGVSSVDLTGCTKSGTTGLLSALASISAAQGKNYLVCAADCRIAKPGSSQEYINGDGAAAFLLGDDDLVATFEGHYSVTYDFPDRWRSNEEKFEHYWEDRFVREEGYTKYIPEAISGLLVQKGMKIEEIDKIVYPGLHPRDHAAITKLIGADPAKLQPLMLDGVGDTSTASPLMLLAAALDQASPGEKILVASYGSGSDAILLQVTDGIAKIKSRQIVAKQLNVKSELKSYEKYLAFRNIMPIDLGIRGEAKNPTPFSALYRERKHILGLYGSICRQCGTPQYPANRICVNPDCHAADHMEDYRFCDKKAVVFNYTSDNLAASVNPPSIYGLIDFDGGGRYWFDFTDCDDEAVEVGKRMEMTFRRKYADELRGVYGYFWKATPVIE